MFGFYKTIKTALIFVALSVVFMFAIQEIFSIKTNQSRLIANFVVFIIAVAFFYIHERPKMDEVYRKNEERFARLRSEMKKNRARRRPENPAENKNERLLSASELEADMRIKKWQTTRPPVP